MKRRLSARETIELFAYCERYPIDDESNFHFPVAQLEATMINLQRAQGSQPVSLFDRLIFGKPEVDIEEQLANDNW